MLAGDNSGGQLRLLQAMRGEVRRFLALGASGRPSLTIGDLVRCRGRQLASGPDPSPEPDCGSSGGRAMAAPYGLADATKSELFRKVLTDCERSV